MDRKIQSLRLGIGLLAFVPMLALVPEKAANHKTGEQSKTSSAVLPSTENGYEAANGRVDFELAVLAKKMETFAPAPLRACHFRAEIADRVACLTNMLEPTAQIAKTSEQRFIPPVYGVITSGFGYRKSPFQGKKGKTKAVMHDGLDLAAPKDAMFVAPSDGTVLGIERKTGYGALLTIAHANGFETRYAHVGHLFVKEGESVRTGQPLGVVGLSGKTTGPHIHFEMKKDGKLIDPQPFLDLPTQRELARKVAGKSKSGG